MRKRTTSWILPASGFLLAAVAGARAESSYIYGLHEPGGEGHMGSSKGWIVFTEAIGHDPNNYGGGNYSGYANAGYGVIVRLNNGYGSDGTIPYQAQYDNFAQRCANFVNASSGVDYWIIGNETNLPREWPGNINGSETTGEPITVARYVSCYNKCYTKIKAVKPDAKLMPTPSGTWSPPWPGQGIEGFLDYWVNILNSIGASKIDGLALHAYTHGCDPALVTSTAKMNPPYASIYYHFFVYRNYMGAIPGTMTTKPVFITECDQNIECADNVSPRHAWANTNSGWVRAIYNEINNWNQANSQKIRCVILFRWPNGVEGDYTFGIQDLNGVIQDFQQACAYGYRWTTSAPAAPTGLAATPGDGQVSLSWNASAGATSYNVKRSTTSGGPYTTIASPTGTSYTNTGLTNGTPYYYVVSAVNSIGESANSSQVSATPVAGGGMNNNTPTGVNVAPSSAQVQTDSDYSTDYPGAKAIDGSMSSKWCSAGTAPPHTIALDLGANKVVNGFIARMAGGESTTYIFKAFRFQSAASMSGPWTDECIVDNAAQLNVIARSYNTPKTLRYVRMYITDTGVDNWARLYEYEVWAVPAPSAPTGLAATPGDGQVSLSWNASAGATSYNVKRSTTSGGPYTTIASPTGTSYTNTGLTNGTPYYYVVSAVSAGGESANSSQVSATPNAAAPTAAFSADRTSGDVPLTVQFIDQSTGTIHTRAWTFGDGQQSTETNPAHTYTEAGAYTVALTVTGPGGSNTLTRTNYITVNFVIRSDFDRDGDVDLTDFSVFQLCFAGPNRPPLGTCSVNADFDGDSDVDLNDFGQFQACFNGPNRPAKCP